MWWLLSSLLFAEEPSMTMVVEASKDIEFYVAPIKVRNYTQETKVEMVIDKDAAFTYAGNYVRNIKVSNGRGGYEPPSITGHKVMVYNDRTIKYAWDDCDYVKDALGCSVQNSHYYLETIVTVDDNQLVVKTTLYDPEAQIVVSSSTTDDKIVRWIRQQEVTVTQQQQGGGLLGGSGGTTTTVHKPKEEMPLKWEIPHSLTDRMIQQLMIGTFVSIRLDLY